MSDFKKIEDQEILDIYPDYKIDKVSEFIKNDITYKTYELSKKDDEYFRKGKNFSETLNTYDRLSLNVPLYNEVLAYFTFLSKYPSIKKPELLSGDHYANHLFFNVGILKVKDLHIELVNKGFYKKASNETILNSLKVSEIKESANKMGLKLKGKKDELINELIKNSNEEMLSLVLGDDFLEISEKGEEWLENNEDLFDYYSSDKEFKSFNDYLEYYKTHTKEDDFKNECLEKIKNDDETFGRYAYDGLISLYLNEDDFYNATLCFLKELLIDMSGAYNYYDWKKFDFDKEIVLECIEPITFTPYLIKEFPKFKKYYDPKMIEEAFKINLPFCACSKIDFQDIAEMMFDKTMDEDTRKIYQNRLDEEVKKIAYKLAK